MDLQLVSSNLLPKANYFYIKLNLIRIPIDIIYQQKVRLAVA